MGGINCINTTTKQNTAIVSRVLKIIFQNKMTLSDLAPALLDNLQSLDDVGIPENTHEQTNESTAKENAANNKPTGTSDKARPQAENSRLKSGRGQGRAVSIQVVRQGIGQEYGQVP